MSTNVKISELTGLDTIDNGGNLVIPVSKNNGSAENKQWTSYSVSGDVLSDYVGTKLGIGELKGKTNTLEGTTRTLASNLDETNRSLETLDEYYSYLESALGIYSATTDIPFNIDTASYYIDASTGEKRGNSNYFISSKITLKQGKLYSFHLGNTVSPVSYNYSVLSKVHTHNYDLYENETGDSGTVVTYEPLPTYNLDYSPSNDKYDSVPKSGDLVFFANENMEVVVSAPTSLPTSDRKLTEIKYGSFMQIANNLLGVNGELMKVLVEAIVKNRKDIDVLYANANSLGKVHVNSIDCDEYPSVQGGPMVRVENRQPTAAEATHGPDVPNRIGQIWVDTSTDNGGPSVYVAVALGNITDWKKISLT